MLRPWMVVLALLLTSGDAGAICTTDTTAPEEGKTVRTPAQQKLDSQLVHAIERARSGRIARSPELQPDVEIIDGRVLVDIDALVSPELLAKISSMGGKVISSFARYDAIRALVPLLALEELAERPDVRFIARAAQSTTNPGG